MNRRRPILREVLEVNRPTAVFLLLSAAAVHAKPSQSVIRYKAPEDPEERPVAVEVAVAPQGSDFAFRVVFDKAPWGEQCKNRCANATVFVDTDNNRSTGLQLGPGAAETGADLAVTLQGTRDYGEGGSRPVFRAKVRYLPDGSKSLEDGETLSELDPQRDGESLQIEENTVFVLVDGSSASLPSGKAARVIYHPPGARALTAFTRGMVALGGGGQVEILKKGVKEGSNKHTSFTSPRGR